MTALNVRIPTDLHRATRIAAINRGKTVQQLVEAALRRELGQQQPADDGPGKPQQARRR